MFDTHGDLVATTLDETSPRDLDATETPAHQDGIRLLGLSRTGPEVLEVRFAAPLRVDDTSVGTLLVRMSAQELLDVTTDYTGLGQTGETIIAALDGTGGVDPLNEPCHLVPATFQLTVTDQNDPAAHVLRERRQEIFSDDAIDYRGEEIWAATRFLPDLELGLVVKFDANEREVELQELSREMFFSALALAGFAILAGIILAMRIAGPIHQLAEVAEKIQNGDFHVRAPVRSEDEIGKLAQAFNQMTDRLLESNRKLQARIDEQQHDDTPDD